MNLTLDIGTRMVGGDAVSLSRSVAGMLKLGRSEVLRIKLVNYGSSFTLGVGASLRFVMKPLGMFEGDVLQEVVFTSADLSEGRYTKTFSTYTSPILEILGVDASSVNDRAFERVMGVLLYTPSGGEREESFEFYVEIHNAVYGDEDSPPDEVEGPEEWLTDRAVRHDAAQSLSDLSRIQGRENIGMVYNAAIGGLVVVIGDGVEAFIPVTAVPA